MNITTQTTQLPLATVVNPPTDNLRRENTLREVISQPAAASQSSSDKGVASDKDKAKTPAQQNEHIDFESIRKQAEEKSVSISERSASEGDQKNHPQEDQESPTNENKPQENTKQEDYADEQILEQLKARDFEVKQHESAHASVGGVHAGMPSYQFTTGPDGKKYATDGEVSVDLSVVANDPQATITKMQKVHAAALAPMNPSSQDISVAAQATQQILQAQSELLVNENSDNAQPDHKDSGIAETSGTLKDDRSSASDDFDQFMDNTIATQTNISPERPSSVVDRSIRVETFYSNISNAYEGKSNNNFSLTA